jgi:NAD(P)-dependent dehydrogenase (short-subunit alcohol dehydrogenase family)
VTGPRSDVLPGLHGKVAVVTGGGRGIGRSTALAFARDGASVAVLDRKEELCEDVAAEIVAAGGVALSLPTDVSSEQQVDAAIETAAAELGGVHFLFANAAVVRFGTLLETPPEIWDQQLAVNLRGVYLCARACLPRMIAAGGGVIVATSSDCAIRTCANLPAYVAAKHAVIGLMRAIAVDHGPDHIRANVVVPGVTETPGFYEWNSIGERTPESQRRRALAITPLRRLVMPEDLAGVVTFLCSEKGAMMTGATIVVDGGATLTYSVD